MMKSEVWRCPQGNGRQVKVEKNCCDIINCAPTTFKVKAKGGTELILVLNFEQVKQLLLPIDES